MIIPIPIPWPEPPKRSPEEEKYYEQLSQKSYCRAISQIEQEAKKPRVSNSVLNISVSKDSKLPERKTLLDLIVDDLISSGGVRSRNFEIVNRSVLGFITSKSGSLEDLADSYVSKRPFETATEYFERILKFAKRNEKSDLINIRTEKGIRYTIQLGSLFLFFGDLDVTSQKIGEIQETLAAEYWSNIVGYNMATREVKRDLVLNTKELNYDHFTIKDKSAISQKDQLSKDCSNLPSGILRGYKQITIKVRD